METDEGKYLRMLNFTDILFIVLILMCFKNERVGGRRGVHHEDISQ